MQGSGPRERQDTDSRAALYSLTRQHTDSRRKVPGHNPHRACIRLCPAKVKRSRLSVRTIDDHVKRINALRFKYNRFGQGTVGTINSIPRGVVTPVVT